MNLQHIREAKAAKVAEARNLVAKADGERRSLTSELLLQAPELSPSPLAPRALREWMAGATSWAMQVVPIGLAGRVLKR